ncbi:MAG: hypothetical protein AABX16_01600 [Nanoarchaeota archaeon]
MKKRTKMANSHQYSANNLLQLPKQKRSQITIFIIIAIILFTAIGFFIFTKSATKQNKEYFIQQGIQPSVNNIEEFSLDCLQQTTKEALTIIGLQGGYYKNPPAGVDLQGIIIPYYYDRGKMLAPSQKEIENQLSLFIDENLPVCFDQIQFKDFTLKYEKPQTKTTISKKEITAATALALNIQHNDKKTTFELARHPYTEKIYLGEMLTIAEYVTQSHLQDPDYICMNCLAQLSKEKNLFVDFISFEEDTTLVMIIENTTQPEPYIFQFLNKYEIKNLTQ